MISSKGQKIPFALRLKQHRELCGLTQQQVADIININRTTYTKYETGVSEPSHEVLRKIVSIFGTDFNSILGDNDAFQTEMQDSSIKLFNLTDDEQKLVISYRAMSDDDRKIILQQAMQKSSVARKKKPEE